MLLRSDIRNTGIFLGIGTYMQDDCYPLYALDADLVKDWCGRDGSGILKAYKFIDVIQESETCS